ncbi:hypothetical protein GCM10010329_03280 [Streptomyces spiroverticillatus]|uniref:SdpA family antimicrobial peptide system protein n=1 Tax=Streptomyces finlayi TaxID=67296 RepID=A0A918WSH5_9ACTN|nr:hypothetical protein GCM10010329_03280 [Streptomyces spiroverticillatus]GHC78230.1 hypothetical protein GCM10010334_03260 [Streptomyces finlayi]
MRAARDLCRRLTTQGPGPRRVPVPSRAVLAVVVVWGVFLLYVAQVQLPKNVLALPGQDRVTFTVANLAPQGWAFFTKSARDAEVLPYGRTGEGSWGSLLLAPHAAPRNAFGLDRGSRSQGIEIALLLDRASEKDWRECGEGGGSGPDGCLAGSDGGAAAPPVRRVENPSPSPTLCGRVALVQEKPVPWAWRDLVPERLTPERLLTLDVTC